MVPLGRDENQKKVNKTENRPSTLRWTEAHDRGQGPWCERRWHGVMGETTLGRPEWFRWLDGENSGLMRRLGMPGLLAMQGDYERLRWVKVAQHDGARI